LGLVAILPIFNFSNAAAFFQTLAQGWQAPTGYAKAKWSRKIRSSFASLNAKLLTIFLGNTFLTVICR
jgi:hypothetical protein